jgi:aryl-alcohol dehydrogenase-like predicted oxidoreductase
MLFGESTSPKEAGRQLGMCLDAGVSFFDTAEMYPVPQQAGTQGRSETILGEWMNGKRRYCLTASAGTDKDDNDDEGAAHVAAAAAAAPDNYNTLFLRWRNLLQRRNMFLL